MIFCLKVREGEREREREREGKERYSCNESEPKRTKFHQPGISSKGLLSTQQCKCPFPRN